MADNPFNAGDVVRLKSGGPVMTVDAALGDGAVICCWFAENFQRYNAIFASATLMPAKPRERRGETEGMH